MRQKHIQTRNTTTIVDILQGFLTLGAWTTRRFMNGFQGVLEDQIKIDIYIRYTALVPNKGFP